MGALNLSRGDRNAVALNEHLVARRRLAVDADQIVARLGAVTLRGEESLDRRARFNVDVVGKAGAVVVDQ